MDRKRVKKGTEENFGRKFWLMQSPEHELGAMDRYPCHVSTTTDACFCTYPAPLVAPYRSADTPQRYTAHLPVISGHSLLMTLTVNCQLSRHAPIHMRHLAVSLSNDSTTPPFASVEYIMICRRFTTGVSPAASKTLVCASRRNVKPYTFPWMRAVRVCATCCPTSSCVTLEV